MTTVSPEPQALETPPETLALTTDWTEVLAGPASAALCAALRRWLPSRRWFRSKARSIQSVTLHEQIAVPMGRDRAFLIIFQVAYSEGESELYVLPLACAFGAAATLVVRDSPRMILARVSLPDFAESGVLYDAIVSREFCRALLLLTAQHRSVPGRAGALESEPTDVLRRIRREKGLELEPKVSKAEQSNSSIIYAGSLILKFFRRLDSGINPELEIERFLLGRNFAYSPALAGALEYHDHAGATSTLAVISSFVPGCHDAWEDTLAALAAYYQRAQNLPVPELPGNRSPVLDPAASSSDPAGVIGPYLQDAATLGRRTAALHLALASGPVNPAFQPEPWTLSAQQSLADSLQELTRRNFELLRRRLPALPAETQDQAREILPLEEVLIQRFERIARLPLASERIRNHGDYHLGQVLHHDSDFLIIDFEGEPALSLEERRAKQSALRDVAGMIYSFFYAAAAALRDLPAGNLEQPEARAAWAGYWAVQVGSTYLKSYLDTAGPAPFIPASPDSLAVMLDAELLRKAVYELGYELNNRPDWLNVCFQLLLELVNPQAPNERR